MQAKRMIRAFVAASLLCVSAPPAAQAQGAKEEIVMGLIFSSRFKVDLDRVKDWRQKSFGWRDIAYALVIADKTGRPAFALLDLHASGRSWNDISAFCGLDAGSVTASVNAIEGLGPPA